jgi:hypothetical protein
MDDGSGCHADTPARGIDPSVGGANDRIDRQRLAEAPPSATRLVALYARHAKIVARVGIVFLMVAAVSLVGNAVMYRTAVRVPGTVIDAPVRVCTGNHGVRYPCTSYRIDYTVGDEQFTVSRKSYREPVPVGSTVTVLLRPGHSADATLLYGLTKNYAYPAWTYVAMGSAWAGVLCFLVLIPYYVSRAGTRRQMRQRAAPTGS